MRRSLLLFLAVMLGMAVVSVPTGQAATSARLVKSNFADPGFVRFGSADYIYRTGAGFHASHTRAPVGGFSTPRPTMYKPGEPTKPRWPTWVGPSTETIKGPHLWAPHVFHNGSKYVMYFTGWSRDHARNCIGIATASSPLGNFIPQERPVVCGAPGHEAIDPVGYKTVAGNRYLIYKTSVQNVREWAIRAVRMTDAGTTRMAGIAAKKILEPGTKMEAPSVILHDHRVFLFTSRRNFADCSYATDVWRATEFWNGSFVRVNRWIMNRDNTGLCGPGGAEVLRDGSRIAFHAWPDANHDGQPDQGAPRGTYIAPLRWNSAGNPYLG